MKAFGASSLLRNHLVRIVLVTAAILLVPLIGMQLSEEVNWTVTDFVVAGVLLVAVGVVFELIQTKLTSRKQKVVAVAILMLAFFYIWAELAVGIFTNLGS